MTTITDATAIQAAASPSESPTKPVQKKKAPRRARRRGAGESESESEDERGASDSSASLASSASASESDHDSEDDEPAAETEGKAVFADVSSTTPAAWKTDNAPTEEIAFDAFNRGESGLAIRGAAKRGRGRGAAVVNGEKERKPLTEEQLKRLEEKRARQKEKLKAKRKEAKEAKRKEREGKDETAFADKQPEASTSEVKLSEEPKEKAVTKKAKGKGRRQDSNASASLVDATNALSLGAQPDESENVSGRVSLTADEPSRRPPVGPRNARPIRPDDPKFTPRTGGFWTHDQRNDFSAEGFGGRGLWRGRGFDRGSPRGGFRGRGRGGFVPPFARGGFVPQPGRGQELTETVDKEEENEGGAKTLEMDKLEAALERQKEQALEREMELEAAAAVEPSGETSDVQQAKAKPAREPKWGHEGFESMQAVAHFQANRMLRGRGRGRGFFGAARGGFIARQPFHGLPTRDRTSDTPGAKLPAQSSAPSRPSPLNALSAVPKSEDSSTAPSAESLLESEAVTVKLPGSEGSAFLETETKPQSHSGSQTNSVAGSSNIRASAPAFVQPKPLLAHTLPPTFSDGTASPQPFPANGSENGSVSSGGPVGGPVYVAGPPEFYPGVNGVSVNGAPAARRPAPFYPSQQPFAPQPQAQAFYPQSYSPDLYHPASRHPSFGSSGYVDARSVSPYPYAPQQNGGYFIPPRSSSKVSIKSPADEKDNEEVLKQYASLDQSVNPMMAGVQGLNGGQQYYAGHYNPYAVHGGGMYDGAWPAGEGYVDGSWGYGY